MSWKSMSGMLTANHCGHRLALEQRAGCAGACLVIQRGSPFHHEIWSTTPGLMPFSGVKAYSTSSLQPSWYLVRSRSNVVMGWRSFEGNLHYRHSNNSHGGSASVNSGIALEP